MDSSHRFNPLHFGARVNPAGASYWSMTPDNLVTYAYSVDLTQVAGPDWANHDHFDIEARFPDGADRKDEKRMLQALLRDRFKLAVHVEKRELESYVLMVGKHPEKLKPSLPETVIPNADALSVPGDSNVEGQPAKPKITRNPDGSSTYEMSGKGTQTARYDQERGVMHWEVNKITMADLAMHLRGYLSGVPNVVDETGIQGNYQVAYDCPLPVAQSQAGRVTAGMLPPDPQDASSLARSLEAMGLRLEKRKKLQDVYVIDHVERPSEN